MILLNPIYQFVTAQFPNARFVPMDSAYSLPSPTWVKSTFASALQTFLEAFNAARWTEESFDCDNFSLFAYSYAQALHNLTQSARPSPRLTGLAIGVLAYTQDSGGKHMVNFVLRGADAESMELLVLEPQMKFDTLKLSKAERASVDFILM